MKLDGATAHFLGVDVQRGRLAPELSHDVALEAGLLNTALELALLTPHMDLLFSQSSSTYGVGVHYGLGDNLDLELKATTSQGTGSSENNILLELQTEL